jgi:hypothetical protein
MPSTSIIAASLPFEGTTISVGTAGSPESMWVVANVEDYNQAMKSTVVMVTNAGDKFVRRQPTIIDPGAPTFKIYWIPLEVSHRNSLNGGTVSAGLRYLMIQQLLRDFQIGWPADPNGDIATDAYKAFVTDFGITGKVAGVYEANITLGINDSNPSFT